MTTSLPIRAIFTTGANLYAVERGLVAGVEQVWNPTLNAGAGGWEAYNSAHWAQYAVALTEQAGSGYFSAAFPAGIGAVKTWETIYQRAGGAPALGDVAVASSESQGTNVQAIAGDPTAAPTLQQALTAELTGAAAGVPTAQVIPTTLTLPLANALAGRSIVFTSGAAINCAGRIISYAPTNGVLTLAAPLAVAPAAADTFLIV